MINTVPTDSGIVKDADGTSALPEFRIHSRGYLPHFEQKGSTYFVTFRLADSLPKEVLLKYREELANRMRTIPKNSGGEKDADETSALRIKTEYEEKIQKYLDNGVGKCSMNNSEVAEVVENSLKHFNGVRYSLYAWCVMPNHVHVLLRPFDQEKLDTIVHSWKSYSSKQANKVLGLKGRFWQPEYYDHLIRSDKEFNNTMDYILNNPIAAGLKDWKWVGYGDVYAEET